MTQNYVVAPGGAGTEIVCSEEVFSTYLRTASSFCSDEAGYEGISGTSMSAPFVSGIAALLAGQGLSNTEIVACITETSDDLGPIGRDPLFGFGRVNAYTAVTEC
jgi:subtilisin family serine protease